MSPLSWGAGDPFRIYLLKPWVSPHLGTASVVVDRTLTQLALIPFLLLGTVFALYSFSFSAWVQWILWISIFLILGITWSLYRQQHTGIFQFLIRLLTRLKIKKTWSEEVLNRAKETDLLITQFYQQHPRAFWISFILQLGVRVLGVVEIYLAATLLNHPIDWMVAYIMASVTAILNFIFVFIPGGLGVMEGAYAGLFHLMHTDATLGTSIQILRRARMILWAIVSAVYFYTFQRRIFSFPSSDMTH